MRVKDKEIDKVNNPEIKRLEKILYQIDKHEIDLLSDFDRNIEIILGDALIPILEEIRDKKILPENTKTRSIYIKGQNYIIPENFLQNFHKSYIQDPNLKVIFEEKLKKWFKSKTEEIKRAIKDVNSYDEVERMLPPSYALASLALTAFHKRPNMILRDVQKLTGIAISEGSIAELGTGEGKTLSAVLPVFLFALRGKGAHVITANGYLARRDFEETLPIYEGLGLTSGFLPDSEEELATIEGKRLEDLTEFEKIELQEKLKVIKQKAYRQDITYGSKQTFAFDYLRDNGIKKKEDMLQREEKPGFALIDEVDDALIDDAQVPYIIAITTPMYQRDMSIRDLCIMLGISYDETLPKIREVGITSDKLTYEEARFIAKTFGHLELLNDPMKYQEAAELFFRIQKVFITEDNTYGFKRGKDLYDALLNESLYEADEIRNNYGIILCRETGDFKISDKCYEEFLKFCYLQFQINSITLKNQNRIINDSNYKEGEHYYFDSNKTLKLTMRGAEKILNDKNYPEFIEDYNRYLSTISSEASIVLHYFRQAVIANLLMKKDEDYIVEDGRIKTLKNGRIQEGSTYSNGLHQALEIKEHIPAQNRTRETTASSTITQKDFYSRYDMFSGMTGTSSKAVFQEVFGKTTVEIPKHAFYSYYGRKKTSTKEPIGVERKNTEFTLELEEKINLIINSIVESQKTKPMQPVLLVVSDVDEIPLLQRALQEKGINFNTLTSTTSKEDEALIIARAGLPGSVTISTEMAGRGTDIKIGGDRETIIDIATARHIRAIEKKQGMPLSFTTTEKDYLRAKVESAIVNSPKVNLWTKDKEERTRKEMETIGLKVISSGFFKIDRIDRQLEGRTGRNGVSGVCERYACPKDLKRIGLTSLNMKDSISDTLRTFRKRNDGSLDINPAAYKTIIDRITVMQKNNEAEVKEVIKNTQKLDNYATSLVEQYRTLRRKIICGTIEEKPLIEEMLEQAVDGIISSFIINKEIKEKELLSPIRNSGLEIDLEAISLEAKQVLGVTFDPNMVEKSNINILELRDALLRTAKEKMSKVKGRDALIVQNDFLIANIPEILEHSFSVMSLTGMSLGMEGQADYMAEKEFDTTRRQLLLEASKHGAKELIGRPLSVEEFKKLEAKKAKMYRERAVKSKTTPGDFEIEEAHYQQNNTNIIAQLKEIRRKLARKTEHQINDAESKISKAEKKGKQIDIDGIYYNVEVRPMMFVSAMVNGKEVSKLVLVRKAKKDEDEKRGTPRL